jgi:hypothetical protein
MVTLGLFVAGLDRINLFQRDDLGWVVVLLLGLEGVEGGRGEYEPASITGIHEMYLLQLFQNCDSFSK